MLGVAGVETSDVPLVPDSIRLGPGVALTELGAFKQGLFFVQDPAATLVAKYAFVPEGGVVVDLCAAPGGKALELSRRARLVFAADAKMARVERMLTGFGRLDATNLIPIVCDARHPAIGEADVVVIDVPCTGTGTWRRQPTAKWKLTPEQLAALVKDDLVRWSNAPAPANYMSLTYNTAPGITGSAKTPAALDAVAREVAFARRMIADNDWPMIDVTRRSVEEIAATILNMLSDNKRTDK